MGMVVNNNIPALFSFNAVTKTGNALQKSIQKLSTGLRINSAADDAAGLAISEKMRAQIRGLDRAVANSQDGISMIQTAEGALNETHSILQRMRELSVQSANDTLTQQDRGYIQLEIDQLREEITRIGNTTQFNKKKLLNGDAAVLWSSDNLQTKAIVNGGLRQIDQFGQKRAAEGNYNLKIRADAGQGEVKKSDIFKIKHKDVVMNVSLNEGAGASGLWVNNLPAGSYTVKTVGKAGAAGVEVTGQYGIGGKYEKLEVTTALAAADHGKKFKISVGGGAATEITVPAAAHAASDIATAIKAANIEGLTVTEAAGKITMLSTKGKIKIENVDLATAFGTAFPTTESTEQTATMDDLFTLTKDDAIESNASILYEVMSVNAEAKTVKLKVTANILNPDGTVKTVNEELTLGEGAAGKVDLGKKLGLASADDKYTLQIKDGMTGLLSAGNKFVHNVTKKAGAGEQTVQISGTQTDSWKYKWGTKVTDKDLNFTLDAKKVTNKELHFKNFYLNSNNGTVYEGDIVLKTNSVELAANKTLATFEAAYIGQVAKNDVKLRDLDKFWDAQGRFMLKDAQTLTLTQGDGKQAKVTLYANDTLKDVADKLNKAIGKSVADGGLGQAQYAEPDGNKGSDHFASFVNEKTATETSESVAGTFVIRSLVTGSTGRISFAGDEDLIKALSLNVIQEAKESNYTVSATDAHTGKLVVSDTKTTGNRLIGALHSNIDVEFDAMAGVKAKWDDKTKSYVYTTEDYKTVLHLADNTTVFQIGANEGEDMGINIGDMRAHALGLNEVLVTDRESAARSITIIDNALDKVSTQRAKLGAYQNRLEHTINNLTVAGENLTAAESRIRDTDMAKEMMNFTKLNIMLQAGNAMLAQANQLPQNVLSLIR